VALRGSIEALQADDFPDRLAELVAFGQGSIAVLLRYHHGISHRRPPAAPVAAGFQRLQRKAVGQIGTGLCLRRPLQRLSAGHSHAGVS